VIVNVNPPSTLTGSEAVGAVPGASGVTASEGVLAGPVPSEFTA